MPVPLVICLGKTKYRGFSRLELLIVTIMLGVIVTVLLNRFLYYQEAAEKARMEYTASALKSALRLRMASLLVQGRAQEFRLLAQDNPMDWLEQPPDNYLGRLTNPDIEGLQRGNWYFDVSSRELVYLVKQGEYFQPDSSGRKQVRLQIVFAHNQSDLGPEQQAGYPTDSVRLVLVEPYQWF